MACRRLGVIARAGERESLALSNVSLSLAEIMITICTESTRCFTVHL